MFFSKTATVLALLPFTIAATCNSANATPYTTAVVIGGGSNGNSNGGSGAPSQATIDATLQSCTKSALTCLTDACDSHCIGSSSSSCSATCLADVCKAFYGSGSTAPNQVKLTACYKAQGLTKRAAVFTCSSSQTCFSETNGNLFCLNLANGDYDDVVGGQGNVVSGDYTSADAVKPATSTSTSTSATANTTATRSSASTTATGNAAAGLSTSTTTTQSSTAATTAAAASPTGGMDKIHANALVGAMGLVLGLVL